MDTDFFDISFLFTRGHTLLRLQFAETANGGANSDGSSGVGNVSTSGENLAAAVAGPDANISALHRVLSAELASVFGVLGDFNLGDLLTHG